MKQKLSIIASHPRLLPLWRRFRRQHGLVLTWHRFTDQADHPSHYPVALLRQQLETLRRNHFEVLALPELLSRLMNPGQDLSRTVALTVDDGYADFAALAADVFLAYDCPVTTFLTTGFLDRDIWMWWDQVEYCLTHGDRSSLTMSVAGRVIDLDLEADRGRTALALWTAMKQVSTPERVDITSQLAALLGVSIPGPAPQQYQAMDWSDIRALSKRGLRFAPHTVNHPVLSRCEPKAAEHEIKESWRRLQEEDENAENVFAYPNGLREDFNTGHVNVLKDLGFQGAVTMTADYATVSVGDGRFAVPRFPARTEALANLQLLSGLELAVRRWRGLGR